MVPDDGGRPVRRIRRSTDSEVDFSGATAAMSGAAMVEARAAGVSAVSVERRTEPASDTAGRSSCPATRSAGC